MKASFLAKAKQYQRESVTFDGETFHVRELSAAEAKEYSAMQQREAKKGENADELGVAAWLALRVVCDEAGNPILEAGDLDALRQMPVRLMTLISKTAARLSGWEDQKKEPQS